MSTVTLNPRRTGPAHGATAATGHPYSHRAADVLRAAGIFVRTAFGVVVLGEYAEEAGVRRTH
ncbi:hypothetical protein AB0C61_38825 [Streptomyces sp. NPDC048680]|uniref:hypothetical protein n=1 Tax=Streptomyces sp. NPDC048680 TaxID=3155492 RepID=UPI003448EC5D